MAQRLSDNSPLRVAIVGAGPAGFYAAEQLLKSDDHSVLVDMYDRLPTPYGLVRAGVAPDHEKIRNVTRKFDVTAEHPDFRFFGNVDVGQHVSVAEMQRFYHMVLFTTGAQVDRRLGIDGEDLPNCHSATEFVAWYNGHPDYADLEFDLSQESVVVIGVGNVAVDVARILCRTPDELSTTDIADYALDALATSRVRDVYMLGRRGPAQAAFTNPEIKELGELEAATPVVRVEELELDSLTHEQLEASPDRLTTKKLEILRGLAELSNDRPKRLHIRFLVSPVRFVAGEDGRLASVELVRNVLVEGRGDRLSAKPTGETELLQAGLAFKSVGYRGVPIPGVPFNDNWGVISNEGGRVTDEGGNVVPGVYAAGWIKRGATGVIGTNKACATETVKSMLEDVGEGLDQPESDWSALEALIRERQPHVFTYEDWKRLDALESERGQAQGRPRVKF
ncbi:MAG: FAD-dependent oxidoreductase, partial [Rhodothermales bacterium]|nr:FAD-dependent oxidoreductase [Rhodothermales bacterium]